MIHLQQCELTGLRIVGAITEIGHAGPKHHGIVLGTSPLDNQTYVVEKMTSGDQVSTVENFRERYEKNGDVRILENDGPYSDYEVAQRALDEALGNKNKQYDLISNNCESFSNRAMYNNSISNQVLTTIAGLIVFVGGIYVFQKTKA